MVLEFFAVVRGLSLQTQVACVVLGSGVIVSADGYVVTNFHVIQGAAQVHIVTNDGETHEAEVIGSNPEADIAVLRIVGGKDFPALAFADSDEVKVGQLVFAVGNPFGLNGTVTHGIISATRKLSGTDHTLLQTDTVINPGNSGGPMVNIRGEIIGINLAIYQGQQSVHTWQGIGFTIPANEAKVAYEGILKKHASNPGRWLFGTEVQQDACQRHQVFGFHGSRRSRRKCGSQFAGRQGERAGGGCDPQVGRSTL